MTKETPNNLLMPHITEAEAKKKVSEMNLIEGFLFRSATEKTEDAQIVVGGILQTIFNRKIVIKEITSEKVFQALDTNLHGVRFDIHATEKKESDEMVATNVDVEMETRVADKKTLPKRLRYYTSLPDSKALISGEDYDKLPNFISVTILSYDPFDAGDMYYEARSVLTTHPNIEYNDGVLHIYLYCNGRPNFFDSDSPIKLSHKHGKKLMEMLKYIVSGQKPETVNKVIEDIDTVVSEVKDRPEVTSAYMKEWERELAIKEDARTEDAINLISFCFDNGISTDKIIANLKKDYGYENEKIKELFNKADVKI